MAVSRLPETGRRALPSPPGNQAASAAHHAQRQIRTFAMKPTACNCKACRLCGNRRLENLGRILPFCA
jgi:hypothetical protein